MSRRNAVAPLLSILTVAACGDGAVAPGVWPHAAGLPRCTQTSAQTIRLPVAGYVSVDPGQDSGCVLLPTNMSVIDSVEYLVVPKSATGVSGKAAPFQLAGASPSVGVIVQRMGPAAGGEGAPGSVAFEFDGFLRRLARTRNYASVAPAALGANPPIKSALASGAAGPPTPGELRTFRVCKVLTCDTLANVAARVKAVGAHIAIYVDTMAPAAGLDSGELDTLKQVFDTRLFPLDTAAFGGVSDIDSNTVAIVLMSGVVNHLVTASQCTAAGFAAGFFFSGDLDPAFRSQYNSGEIFYPIVADPSGTLSCSHSSTEVKRLMPVTFTHEFQHMINYVQHVLVRGGQPEEGWVDEGLSRYAEELGGRSYLPGDQASFSQYAIGNVFDAYQYLSATGNSPLVIPEDNGTLADAGASWLFMRYLVDQLRTDTSFGASAVVTRKLVQTSLTGAANVGAQTGEAFEAPLVRGGGANWVSDLPGFTAPPALQYTSWHFRTTSAS